MSETDDDDEDEELSVAELLEPDANYEDEIFCLQIAKGDYFLAKKFYEEIPAIEVYRHFAKLEVHNYLIREANEKAKDPEDDENETDT